LADDEARRRSPTRKEARVTAISRFPVPDVNDLPDDLRERILAVQERTGFVPNVFLGLAHRPDELRAFLAYHDAVMDRPGPLTAAERELVVVATSAAWDCTYCIVAHGAILRIRAKHPVLADLVAANPLSAPLDDRQRAVVRLALQLSTAPQTLGEADLQQARDAGLDDETIWDVGAVTSLFALSNRMAHLMALRPNPEFHLMGRLPRG
jgi:uncharacterized peroxidase-related enzyme